MAYPEVEPNRPDAFNAVNAWDPFAALAQARHSTRAFTPNPVAPALLHALLASARQAPSGGNLQPGQWIEVRGAKRAALTAALTTDWQQGTPEQEDYGYFPRPMPMGLRKRQVVAAQALYGALGVGRDDRSARAAQFGRNFAFFDAPVALVATIDASFGSGGFMDFGMALYGLMLAAESRGLGCCAIGALASYPHTVRQVLGLPANELVVCGMALGWPDTTAPVNQARTQRAALGEYFRTIE